MSHTSQRGNSESLVDLRWVDSSRINRRARTRTLLHAERFPLTQQQIKARSGWCELLRGVW